MKFKITLTPSNYYQDAKKSKYLNPVVVESLEDFKKVILKDYACAVYIINFCHKNTDVLLQFGKIKVIQTNSCIFKQRAHLIEQRYAACNKSIDKQWQKHAFFDLFLVFDEHIFCILADKFHVFLLFSLY